jgi:hypothetical protein
LEFLQLQKTVLRQTEINVRNFRDLHLHAMIDALMKYVFLINPRNEVRALSRERKLAVGK